MTDMNSNWERYELHATYKIGTLPRMFATKPWWIKTPYPTYQPNYGCMIEPLICGEKVFGAIAYDLKNARRCVDIITWGFDPGMVLVRGANANDGQRYGDLLIEIATRKPYPVEVRLLVWHGGLPEQFKMNNMPGYYGKRFPAIGCSETGYYNEARQRYNAVWFDRICANEVPNIHLHVRSLPSSLLGQLLSDESSKWGATAIASKTFLTHHQKMVLIDYEDPPNAVGYVMGHNSITDFWDTEEHLFRNPRRERIYQNDPVISEEREWAMNPKSEPVLTSYVIPEYPPSDHELKRQLREMQMYLDGKSHIAKPYQDVSCRLQGTILFDLNDNFCEGWSDSRHPHSDSIFPKYYWLATTPIYAMFKAQANLQSPSHPFDDKHNFIERRKTIEETDFRLPNGTHDVQLMRTYPKPILQTNETAIKECYANLNRQMQHYIFIQNQYIQYDPWADHLKECIQRLRVAGYLKKVYVFVLTSTPENNGMDLPTYDVVSKIGHSESMVTEDKDAFLQTLYGKGKMPITAEEMAEQGINVVIGSLWTCEKEPSRSRPISDNYEEIYIHAKVAIVDDAAFTLGSANLNLRSMALDSELNILSDAHDVAYKLRADLFKQCSGDAGPAKFGDMKNTFNQWGMIMKKNSKRKDKFETLSCQLLPFHVDRKPGAPLI